MTSSVVPKPIPDELLLRMIELSDPRALCKWAIVCKEYNSLIRISPAWENYLKRDFAYSEEAPIEFERIKCIAINCIFHHAELFHKDKSDESLKKALTGIVWLPAKLACLSDPFKNCHHFWEEFPETLQNTSEPDKFYRFYCQKASELLKMPEVAKIKELLPSILKNSAKCFVWKDFEECSQSKYKIPYSWMVPVLRLSFIEYIDHDNLHNLRKYYRILAIFRELIPLPPEGNNRKNEIDRVGAVESIFIPSGFFKNFKENEYK